MKQNLPVAEIIPELKKALERDGAAVVTAPPGSGKSTLLPIMLMGDDGKKILMLEPRRIAARQVADRLAWMIDEPVGRTVGYRIRFENRVSSETRLEVLTEGILTRMLIDDPSLEGVGTVIFDEFHERNLFSDEALALVRNVRDVLRPDLRIVIMSATIDAGAITEALGCQLVESKGRQFGVRICHLPGSGAAVEKEVAAAISRAFRETDGSILAFLPGEGEIRRTAEMLAGHFEYADIFPLYGMLPLEDQRKAIAPSARRKIVLATPVAETSITIEGVSVVVDSGLHKKMVFDPRSALGHLETVRISEDMATQRAGRAGRTCEGVCYRLWSSDERLEKLRRPEILDADLAPLALDLSAWGSDGLPWLTPPSRETYLRALGLLESLGAVSDGKLTPEGRRMRGMPCHPRIAKMLIAASSEGEKRLAAELAAILEDRDPAPGAGADITLRLGAGGRRLKMAVEQYCRLAGCRPDSAPDGDSGRLIAAAYPERVAQSRGAGNYLMSGGEMARLDPSDPLAAYDYLAVASVDGGWIRMAAPADPRNLPCTSRENVSWDAREGRVVARTERRLGKLLIDSTPLPNVTRERILEVICAAAPRYGLEMFDFTSVENLRRRIAFASARHPELELPDLSPEAVSARAAEWLPFFAGKASTSAELKKIDLGAALWSLLDYGQQRSVEAIAPEAVEVPTGSRIRLEYRAGAEMPVLRVRLQECFGMTDTPLVDGRPVLMELLSPGFKPVQLTSDLRSFWSGTYFEVRAELRRRYPRHSWPDNPLEADPVRGVRKR